MKKQNRQVVLITGASSGIGKACANYLHQRGYRVFGTSRHAGSRTEKETKKDPLHSDSFELIRMDVTSDISVKQLVDHVLETEGRLDIVINNAGFGYAGSVEDTSIDEAKSQFETNFFGVLRVCRAVLPIMRKRHSGTIVNISSMAGLTGIPFQGLYSASKFALEGMTESLRMEVQPFGIHVALIEPGDFQTEFTARRRRTSQSRENPAYLENFKNALAVMEADEMKGSSPEKIAQLLEQIVKTSSPRLHYTIGSTSEKIGIALKKIMPARLFEWILMKHLRLLSK